MAEKKQRTVYRLTLVKSWNMEEADSYVELIEKGQPGKVKRISLLMIAMNSVNYDV